MVSGVRSLPTGIQWRRASAAFAAATVVVLLSSCTAQDRIGARLNAEDDLELVVCETLDINRIEVREERDSDTDPVNELWVATGEYALDDLHLTFGKPPPGMSNEVSPETPLPTSFVFYAEKDDESGNPVDVVQATFTTSDLNSDTWRMSDGRVLEDPPC